LGVSVKSLFLHWLGIGLLGVAASAGATNFLIGVDPDTGEAKLFVGAGVATPGTTVGDLPVGDATPGTTYTGSVIFPSLQAEIQGQDSGISAPLPSSSPEFASLDPGTEATIIAQAITYAGPEQIEALLRSRMQIDAENAAFIASLDQSLGGEPVAGGPGFDSEERERYTANQQNLLNLIASALDGVALGADEIKAIIDQANRAMENGAAENGAAEPPPADPATQAELKERQLAQQQRLLQIQRERQQKLEQERKQREEMAQRNQELLDKVKQAQTNKKAMEEKRAEAERKALQQRLKASLLAGGGASRLDPELPATPQSIRDHMSGVSGPGSEGGVIAGAPVPDEGLGDVHTDYANQEQQSETIEEAAEELAALDPDPVDPWDTFLANNDGPRFEGFPSESISGEAVGVYNGLVRGGFEDGPSANGTMSLSISFDTFAAMGQITFDNDQGVMSVAGDVTGPEFGLDMEGHVFGGTAVGGLNGLMYGANGEEIGGGWGLHMLDGELVEQSASGRFAAKQ
jgi:hypothetical protein